MVGWLVQAYFKQVTVDTQVLATSFTQLLDGNLTTAMPPDTSLRSYALDPSNFYSYPLPNGATKTYNASGYFDVVRYLFTYVVFAVCVL